MVLEMIVLTVKMSLIKMKFTMSMVIKMILLMTMMLTMIMSKKKVDVENDDVRLDESGC